MLKLARKVERSPMTPMVETLNKKMCNNVEENMIKEDINFLMKEFINYKISVDGGNRDLKTVQQSRQQVLTILAALGTKSLSILFDRTVIRENFLFRSIKEREYAPQIIQRYLLSLIHFYDFVICKDIAIDGVSPEENLRMKVIINTFFMEKLETYVS